MLRNPGKTTIKLWRFALAVVLAVTALLGFLFNWLAAAVFLLLAVGWGFAIYSRARIGAQQRQIAEITQRLEKTALELKMNEQLRADDSRRFETLMHLNRGLIEAEDEQGVMDAALSAVTGLVGGLGCSFVPVDEWDQPLPAFTHGSLPEPVLRAWAAHLTDGMLRDRCGSCSVLESNPGGCPLHPQQIGETLSVYCIPLSRSNGYGSINNGNQPGRQNLATLGILHLYLPHGKTLDDRSRIFLDSLLQEIALAYESIQMRSQERSTLRNLQFLHSPEMDLHVNLSSLLDGLKQAIEADDIYLRLRPSADDRLNGLVLPRGLLTGLTEADLERVFDQVIQGRRVISAPGTLPVWIAVPLVLPDENALANPLEQNGHLRGRVLGMLLAGMESPHTFHPRQETILQTVAAQATLLVENEHIMRSLEYKVVIQERARLAREIHDGLAQTLAFLKLQSAQMQSYLAQGDISRLSLVLKENYQALAEAYLDTRQAIDNLRLTPQDGLETWLERITGEFENSTGISVDRAFDARPISRMLTPEVQAQLIRIIQEALSNVRKHARAQNVKVSLREWDNELILEVSDNGMGFDAGDVPEVSQHGLRGMRERAELIGADFQIISQVRQGTTVRLVLPASLEEETQQ